MISSEKARVIVTIDKDTIKDMETYINNVDFMTKSEFIQIALDYTIGELKTKHPERFE